MSPPSIEAILPSSCLNSLSCVLASSERLASSPFLSSAVLLSSILESSDVIMACSAFCLLESSLTLFSSSPPRPSKEPVLSLRIFSSARDDLTEESSSMALSSLAPWLFL